MLRWLAVSLLVGQVSAASIAGTQWRFPKHESVESVVTFRDDGVVTFSNMKTTGHWKQDGNQVVFDANDFTEYRVVIDGAHMKGQWTRLKGKEKGETSPTSLERL